MNIFVTGTGLNIGKTFVSVGLIALMQSLGYKCGLYKPIQIGVEEKNNFLFASDANFAQRMDPFIKTKTTYLFRPKTTPVLASEFEKTDIEMNSIIKDFNEIKDEAEILMTEDCGGLALPLTPTLYVSDIAKVLKLPILIIVPPEENALNQTLLAINYAIQQGLNIRGVIINKYPQATNDITLRNLPRLIEEYSPAKVLGLVKDITPTTHRFPLSPSMLIDTILNSIDVEKVFDMKIPKLQLNV